MSAVRGLGARHGYIRMHMLIRCPSCGHSREINPDRIPARAEFATCPKCSHRFRFRALDPVDTPAQPDAGTDGTAPGSPEAQHKDIWDAVDSLHERWKKEDEENGRPSRDLGRLEDYDPEENRGFDNTGGEFIPWEKPRELGFLASLYRTMLMALLHPRRFFSGLSARPPLAQPLLFYIIFGILQSSANMFWWHMALQSSAGPTLAESVPPQWLAAMDISHLPLMVLTSPLVLSLYLFVMSGLMHLMIRLIEPQKANFIRTFKVVGYASAAMIFAVVPFVGVLLAPLCYMLLLLAGCRYAYGISWLKAFLVLITPYILFFLLNVGQVGVNM